MVPAHVALGSAVGAIGCRDGAIRRSRGQPCLVLTPTMTTRGRSVWSSSLVQVVVDGAAVGSASTIRATARWSRQTTGPVNVGPGKDGIEWILKLLGAETIWFS